MSSSLLLLLAVAAAAAAAAAAVTPAAAALTVGSSSAAAAAAAVAAAAAAKPRAAPLLPSSAAAAAAALSSAAQAGVKATVTQAGLDLIHKVGVEELQLQLATLQIPNIEGEAHSKIGTIEYQVTDIKLTNVQLPAAASTLAIVANQGLKLGFAQVAADLSANFHFDKKHWPHASGSGSVTADMRNADVEVQVRLTEANGRLQASVISDTFNVGDLTIKEHGGPSWLYDFLLKELRGTIDNSIDKAITSAMTNGVNKGLNGALQKLPGEVGLPSKTPLVELSYLLTGNPTFAAGSHITAPLSGAFRGAPPHTDVSCPSSQCAAAPMPDTVSPPLMVQMMLSEAVLDSAAYAYWKLGLLQATINQADVPKKSPVALNTTSLKYFLPTLYAAYPDQLVELHLAASTGPRAQFVTGAAHLQAKGTLAWSVYNNSNTKRIPVFTLAGVANASMTATFQDGSAIVPNIGSAFANFTLEKSEIGPIDLSPLDGLVKLLVLGIVPVLNSKLANGIPLPTVPGLTFLGPQLTWNPHYLSVNTDIDYVPVVSRNAAWTNKAAFEA